MWIIEYGDERGNQASKRYATALEAIAGLDSMAKTSRAMAATIRDAQTEHGYSLQTHSFHAYSEEWGNHTVYVLNLDTHDENGYEREPADETMSAGQDDAMQAETERQATEVPTEAVRPLTERTAVLVSLLEGLTWYTSTNVVLISETDSEAIVSLGREGVEDFALTLKAGTTDIYVRDNHRMEYQWYSPMDALTAVFAGLNFGWLR
jgi:hypothetical protein